MFNQMGHFSILQHFLTSWLPPGVTHPTAMDWLSRIQKGIHPSPLFPLPGRATVSILALSRVQRDEMSSDVAPDCGAPTGTLNPNSCFGEVARFERDSRATLEMFRLKVEWKREKREEREVLSISISRQIWERRRKGARLRGTEGMVLTSDSN